MSAALLALLVLPVVGAVDEVPVSSTLDFERAVEVGDQMISLGPARFTIESGVLVPLNVDGKAVEFAFSGKARLELDPPDDVERLQLWLHSGEDRVDAEIERAVLVVASAGVREWLMGLPRATADGEARATLQSMADGWQEVVGNSPSLQAVMYRTRLDDPLFSSYRGLWFPSYPHYFRSLFYQVDPTEREQVSLRVSDVVERQLDEDEEDGGENDEDDGDGDRDEHTGGSDLRVWWHVWLSMPLPLADGSPLYGHAGFEPEHYELDVEIDAEGECEIRADLTFRATGDGARVLTLRLADGLEVESVLDSTGEPLTWRSFDTAVLVRLSGTVDSGGEERVTLRYGGSLLKRYSNGAYRLRHPVGWYPRYGSTGATFDVTFHWPESLQLVASGLAEEGGGEGEGPEGRLRQRRTSAVRTPFFSFELGHYEIVEEQFGPVLLTVAFNKRLSAELDPAVRANVVATIKAALASYSRQFGMYPLGYLTVVTVPGYASMGLLGFVRLSDPLLFDPTQSVNDAGRVVYGTMTTQEVRIEIVAHEIAHQWWGNRIGPAGYRDAWLSEALADYTSAMFCSRLWADPDFVARQAATRRRIVEQRSRNGRRLTDLGPIVVGFRLHEHDDRAYQAIVYNKGAMVFTMLARLLGEEALQSMLSRLATAVDHGTIDTETFLAALEKMSGVDLDAFARRFVYGIDVPEVRYEYEFVPDGEGWIVRGEAKQFHVLPQRLAIRKSVDSGWKIERVTFEPSRAWDYELSVPFQVAFQGTGKGVAGRLQLNAETTPFEFRVAAEPGAFQLDPRGEVLADFVDCTDQRLDCLRRLGFRQIRAGRLVEARQTLSRALEAATTEEEQARVRLQLARLAVEQGEVKAARDELERVERFHRRDNETRRLVRGVLEGRVELLRGEYDRMITALRHLIEDEAGYNLGGDLETMASPAELMVEVYLLLAIAFHEEAMPDLAAGAVILAEASGADTGPLRGLLPTPED